MIVRRNDGRVIYLYSDIRITDRIGVSLVRERCLNVATTNDAALRTRTESRE